MQKVFWLLVVWLLGTATVGAQSLFLQPETLTYRVSFAGFTVGSATLTYTPTAFQKGTPTAYSLRVSVQDSTPLFNLTNRWQVTGSSGWQSRTWESWQHEGNYQAHKSLTFNPANRTALFQNLSSSTDPSQTIALPPNTQDVMSILYGWRSMGPSVLTQGQQRWAIAGGKTPFQLPLTAGQATRLQRQPVKVVTITHLNRKKKRTDTWRIWVTATTPLIPVKIEATLPFGTFTALLQSRS